MQFLTKRTRRHGFILAGMAALGLGGAAGAQEKGADRIGDPPVLTTSTPPLAAAQEASSPATPGAATGPEVRANLDVVTLRSRIWNANSQMFDQVDLRAYQDAARPTPPDRPYVAPTLVAQPGNTVRILMRNLLADEPGCPGHGPDINIPHCFNTTNLHTHGLWVSPAGISDNVLRTLPPNKTFTYEYEYNIPADHPAGTFWYHPHVHGSTAIQVASGLAGALIIKGERLPSRDMATGKLVPGDIDVLMRDGGKPAPDQVFVFQQIQYICRDPNSTTTPKGPKTNPDGTWRCDPGDVGVLDGYDVFGGSKFATSGRFTTVNGATMAPLEERATAGVPQRWRFIHGGVADTIRVSIRKKRPNVKALSFVGAGALSQDQLIAKQCEPVADALPQFEIATDGLTRAKVFERSSTTLQPGYRSDVLIAFPEPGAYCVIDEVVNVAQSGVTGGSQRRQLLFTVDVDPGQGPAPAPREQVKTMLVTAAEALPIADQALKSFIVGGLQTDLDLAAFTPHESLDKASIDTHQKLYFSLNKAWTRQPDGKLGLPQGAGIGHTPDTLRRFDPKDFERTLVLGNTDEWELRIDSAGIVIGHPFHIHVNPFEIIAVEKGGVEQTAIPTSQYFGLKGTFKDTIFVEPDTVVRVRSHYRRYVGDFVLHCHILNHEDVGMMEMVRIADRGADGKPIPFGHGLTDGSVGEHGGH